MIRFTANSFVAAFFGIELLQSSSIMTLGDDGEDPGKVAEWRAIASRSLADFAKECRRAGFPSLADRCDSLMRKMGVTPVEPMLYMLRDLLDGVTSELNHHLFFWVPRDRQKWYADDDAALFSNDGPFPPQIGAAMPSGCAAELAEAARCLALARWTACVFHLMRATELALHKWAIDLNVTVKGSVAQANWQDIITGADKRLRDLSQATRTPERDADLEYFGDTSAHFRAIKDAWRNHVSHGRRTYDERQALAITNSVISFMETLAKRPVSGELEVETIVVVE